MAQTKKELVEAAEQLGISVDSKLKVAEIKALIDAQTKSADESVAVETPAEPETTLAKAGKRSHKALEKASEKQAKEGRKTQIAEADATPKSVAPPTRSRLERRARQFRKSAEQLEAGKSYSLDQAIALAKKTSHVKFDATVELHANLGVDPRHADQNIRDNVVLPAGTGKTVRVAVFTDDAAAAKAAGADLIGSDDLLAAIDKGIIDFDILITTPQLMARLGKYARILGPRGLMPNPKSGTVSIDIAKAVSEARSGRVEYRVDSTGIVHLGVGKVSFSEAQLSGNVLAVLNSIKSNKPASLKGTYLNAVYLTTTMGPSIRVEPASIS